MLASRLESRFKRWVRDCCVPGELPWSGIGAAHLRAPAFPSERSRAISRMVAEISTAAIGLAPTALFSFSLGQTPQEPDFA